MANNPASNVDYANGLPGFSSGPPAGFVGVETVPLTAQKAFKFRGLYNGAFEYWIAYGVLQFFPPSGHAVTEVSYERLF